jgi:hypothetical protein
MTKRTKRFIAGLLTASMVVASAFTVAAETKTVVGTYDVSGNSVTYEPFIKINVPTNGADLLIDPYGTIGDLKGNIDAEVANALGLKDTVSNASIISPQLTVENKSEIDLKMTIQDFRVTPSKTASENYITIASSSVADKKNAVKSAYIYLQVAKDETLLGQHVKEANGKSDSGKNLYKLNETYKNALKKTVWELKAKAGKDKNGKDLAENKGATLKDIEIKKDGKVYLKLMGDVNSEPIVKGDKNTKDLWTPNDKLAVSYKLVFSGVAETQGK